MQKKLSVFSQVILELWAAIKAQGIPCHVLGIGCGRDSSMGFTSPFPFGAETTNQSVVKVTIYCSEVLLSNVVKVTIYCSEGHYLI